MKEKIYCPKCDKSNVKTIVGEQGGEGEASRFLKTSKNDILRRGIGGLVGSALADLTRKSDEVYFPVSYQCMECEHTFLSMETNLDEIRRARKNQKSGLVIAILGVLFFVPYFYIISTMLQYSASFEGVLVWCFLFAGLLLAWFVVFGIKNIIVSGKAIKELEEQLEQLEQCQSRHRSLYY